MAGTRQPYAFPGISELKERLETIISDNNLFAFFDSDRLNKLVETMATTIDFEALAANWNISRNLIVDLAPLALYDIIIFIDDSSSMAFEDHGGRISQLRLILSRIADVATLFDSKSGVELIFMNSAVQGEGIRSSRQVEEILLKAEFKGMTPIGTQLKAKLIDPFVLEPAKSQSLEKPVLAIILTDGEPTREPRETLSNVIIDAKEALGSTIYGPGALAIQIAQIGLDEEAKEFIASIDVHPIVGRMVDCTSAFELEKEEFARKGVELTPEMWMLKLCVGAIDRSYDEADE
eukprot:jgi/Hompol1/6968/HPOL_000871-RA